MTKKEWLVAYWVSEGLINREIAKHTGTTEFVIKNYLRDIYNKLGFWNRTELAMWYVKQTFKRDHPKAKAQTGGI